MCELRSSCSVVKRNQNTHDSVDVLHERVAQDPGVDSSVTTDDGTDTGASALLVGEVGGRDVEGLSTEDESGSDVGAARVAVGSVTVGGRSGDVAPESVGIA